MKNQPNRSYESEDRVYTPDDLARAIVAHVNPTGATLEPCSGEGAFLEYMPTADWCEIEKGRDFFAYRGHVDWIVTNPPWSLYTKFLEKAVQVADNIAFLATLNHAWTTKRLRILSYAGMRITEITLVDPYPVAFPSNGCQLGVVVMQRVQSEKVRLSSISWNGEARSPRSAIRASNSRFRVVLPDQMLSAIFGHFGASGSIVEPWCVAPVFAFAPAPGISLLDMDGPDVTGAFDWAFVGVGWGKISSVLPRAMSLADNVVFLLTPNKLWMRSRIRQIRAAGFRLDEIVLMDPKPTTVPIGGFPFAAIKISRGPWAPTFRLTTLKWR